MKYNILIIFLVLSSAAYPQWIVLNSGTSQNLNSIFFINGNTGFAAGAGGTIIKTTNAGQNWSPLTSGTSTELRSVFFINSSTGLACGYNGTMLRTTNGGINWSSVTSGTTDHLLGLSFSNDTSGICSGNSGTILYTANGGVNWSTGYPQGYFVTFYCAFMINSSAGYCAGVNTIFSPLVAKTTNGGLNWDYSSFMLNNNEGNIRDIHFFDTQNGIAVSTLWNGTGGISKTTNGAVNWTTQLFTYGFTGMDFPVPLTGYAVGGSGYIVKTTDGGNNWLPQASNITTVLRATDFTDSINGYAAGDAGTILKTTNGGITSAGKSSNEIPDRFILYQNYPNPFNPASEIEFLLPVSERIKLSVFNTEGKEVSVLINEYRKSGLYHIKFNASGLQSGVYFYRLSTETYSQTKKMIYIK